MKKYLMTGIAALAMCAGFTSCSHDLEAPSQEDINNLEAQKIANRYNQAFIATFGQPASNQDWGFSTTSSARALTRANPGESYPATHEYKDANGNVIAGANMNHNQWGSTDLQSNPFGGWIVPDPLTEGQKLRVQKYFQSHQNPDNQDPHFRHFFVQQVYTGGTDKTVTTGNKEQNVAADGTTKTGASLNQLTVGVANSHINDFNSGTCSASNVLNHEGKTQSDQITLMVNVYDTSCFGYHETSGSNVNSTIQHNDKWALVSASIIDAWGDANNIGETVDDKWHRSFMGFDYEMLPESDVIVPNTFAMLNQVQNINNCQYAVYNGTVMKIGQKPAGEAKEDRDITDNLIATSNDAKIEKKDGILVWNGKNISVPVNVDATGYTKLVIEYAEATPNSYNLSIGVEGGSTTGYDPNRKSGETKVECELVNVSKITNLTFMNGNADFKINKVYLTSGANDPYYESSYLLAGTEQIPFYSTNTNMYGGEKITLTSSDFYTSVDGKNCLNLDRIKYLYDQGYRPIDTALWNWVKYVPVSDGYYSDWIVTLTEAQRITTPPTEVADLRIMAEDLSATEASDFDFNDVVFDVFFAEAGATETKILVRAAGGTLPLRIKVSDTEWQEVHGLWGLGTGIMINTGAEAMFGSSKGADNKGSKELTLKYAVANAAAAKNITIQVQKTLANGQTQWMDMTAETGEPAAKFAIPAPNPDAENWCRERTPIQTQYTKFTDWVQGQSNIKWWLGTSTE